MEPIIGCPKFSLEILVQAAVLDTQDINLYIVIIWAGE